MSKDTSPRVAKLHHARSQIDDATVLLSLYEVGAYGVLAQGPATADEIALELGLVPRRLKPFLELAAHLGMLLYEGGRFSLHEGDEEFFEPTLPYAAGLPATTLSQFLDSRGHAPDILRGGATIEVPAAGAKTSVAKKAEFLRYMDAATREPALELAALIPDGNNVRTIIDLGCGPGTYAYAALERFAQARALLVDRPEAQEEVGKIAAERGLAERVNFQALDLSNDEIPTGHNVAILSNVVHCFDAETNARLIDRIARSLAPGGTLLIKDCAIDDDRSGPADVLRFGISMVMFSQQGGIYSAKEVVDWCRRAGLRHVSTHRVEADANYVVVATL
jgi:SAM-dependent methyltransferase